MPVTLCGTFFSASLGLAGPSSAFRFQSKGHFLKDLSRYRNPFPHLMLSERHILSHNESFSQIH